MGINQFEQTLVTKLLQVWSNILTLDAQVFGNFLNASNSIGGKIYLSTAEAVSEDFLHFCKMFVSLCAECKCVRLLDRIDFVFDFRESVKNLLIAIALFLAMIRHFDFFEGFWHLEAFRAPGDTGFTLFWVLPRGFGDLEWSASQ